MKKIIPLTLLLAFACEDNFKDNPESDLLFITSEGTFGDGNGSISVFQGNKKIQTIDNVGDVIQSLLIHQDKFQPPLQNDPWHFAFDAHLQVPSMR